MKVSPFEYASLFISTMRFEIERRHHNRYPFFHSFLVNRGSDRKVNGFDCDRRQGALHAFSLDISHGGISLVSEDSLEPEEQIVHLRRRNCGDDGRMIRGRVVACGELANGFFKLGIAFAPSRLKMVDLYEQSRSSAVNS